MVRSPVKEPKDDCWAGLVSVIELDPHQFTSESTAGLDQFSHVEVVFLFDRVPPGAVQPDIVNGDVTRSSCISESGAKKVHTLDFFVAEAGSVSSILRRKSDLGGYSRPGGRLSSPDQLVASRRGNHIVHVSGTG